MRLCVLVVAAALLGGCFYSEDPLIGRFAVDMPLAEGTYAHTPYHPDGTPFPRPTWTGEIEREGGRYVSDIADFPHEGVRLREISDGVFAAMKPDPEGYAYGLVFVYPGDVATYHQPSCSNLEAAARDRYDLSVEQEGYCLVDDWDVLSAVLLTYLAQVDGQPRIDGIYRRTGD